MASIKATSSPLLLERLAYNPPLPPAFNEMSSLVSQAETEDPSKQDPALKHSLEQIFPKIVGQPILSFKNDPSVAKSKPLIVGVVLSGGQAPGGHNVIAGLFDALKKINPDSQLIGFVNGPGGIVDNKTMPITSELLAKYRNTGGFDIIGSGRTKIQSKKQFMAAKRTVETLNMDGLVVIGGDDSNTNAALIAEFFAQQNVKCKCVGVPKTIDGDLANHHIEISFGFDTCVKTFATEVGNICRDARSAVKYWFFIKMMGRSASHIALETGMQCHPNMTIVSEEVLAKKTSMKQLVSEIADMVQARSAVGKDYGVVLIPEGLVEFIPEIQHLIRDLNRMLATKLHQSVLEALTKPEMKCEYIESTLTGESAECYASLPLEIQTQLIMDRDPHGNVAVSQIETEKLMGQVVGVELERRKAEGQYKGKFDCRTFFCGYEGRAGFPSNFDSKYCYALGHTAAALLKGGKNGYISCVKNLNKSTSEWTPYGIPLTSMMNIEERHGEQKPVIKKYLVTLDSEKFKYFASQRDHWKLADDYRYPGPIQFFGPEIISEDSDYHLKSVTGALSKL